MTCYVNAATIPPGIISDKNEEYKLTCKKDEYILNFYDSLRPDTMLFQINTRTHTLTSSKGSTQCIVRNMGSRPDEARQTYLLKARAFPEFELDLRIN